MTPAGERIFTLGTLLLAGLTVIAAVAGGVLHHSDVPFWDMWDGYLQFYLRATDGDIASWWAQHNEHRILLARALFFLDLRYFAGKGAFLIATHYIIIAASAALIVFALREALRDGTRANHRSPQSTALFRFLACLSVAWLFSWIQHENLTWAFQSQFLLAQCLPLAALLALYLTTRDPAKCWPFPAACGLGILSAASMANGILALPLLTATALVLRLGKRKIAILGLLSLAMLLAYFLDYAAPAGHGSMIETLQTSPFQFLRYTLRYLGSPFYHLTGGGSAARAMAVAAGALLLLLAALRAFRIFRGASARPIDVVMLAYLGYVVATAIGTAGGRTMFGANQVFQSRYATPALMAWTALVALYAPVVQRAFARTPLTVATVIVLILATVLAGQRDALSPNDDDMFNRSVAALALAMQIDDDEQIGAVFPSSRPALEIAARAADANLSVFADFPYREARHGMRFPRPPEAKSNACLGAFDTVTRLDREANFLKISGWFSLPSSADASPRALRIIDAKGITSGFAMVAEPDINDSGSTSQRHRFSGYAASGISGRPQTLSSDARACTFIADVPAPADAVPAEVKR